MHHDDLEPLRRILHRAVSRYLTVTSHGLLLADTARPRPLAEARLLGFGGARTLYRDRKPVCRSLDAVASVDRDGRRCAGCVDHDACTRQVRVDLVIDKHAYRLLLAFTSATNFLAYVGELQQKGLDPLQADHELRVVPRGSWGELKFRRLA
ncbi:MAG: hypothetical protein FJ265_08125 [Planctomycetes bacterium]|nr:hypothetical protein [Planctomycetota bacterium]